MLTHLLFQLAYGIHFVALWGSWQNYERLLKLANNCIKIPIRKNVIGLGTFSFPCPWWWWGYFCTGWWKKAENVAKQNMSIVVWYFHDPAQSQVVLWSPKVSWMTFSRLVKWRLKSNTFEVTQCCVLAFKLDSFTVQCAQCRLAREPLL